jgi:GH35 family endo-1,4-beta-xylanase
VRGHTLIWHVNNPSWLPAAISSTEAAEATLRTHVERTVARYGSRAHAWDVVNEPVGWLGDRWGARDSICNRRGETRTKRMNGPS